MDLLEALSTAAPSHSWTWWVAAVYVALVGIIVLWDVRGGSGFAATFCVLMMGTFVALGGASVVEHEDSSYAAEREQAITTYLAQDRDLAVVADIVEHEPGPDGSQPAITTIAADRDGTRYDITIIFPNDSSDDLTVAVVPVTQTATGTATN